MRENSVIVLIGPMGAGKSTVGRILASILGKQFLDSDEQIEKNAGASIPYIFEAEGEKGFRAREESTIRDLISGEGIVLATGGGAVLSANTRKLLKLHDITHTLLFEVICSFFDIVKNSLSSRCCFCWV